MPKQLITRVVVDSTSCLLSDHIGNLPLSIVPMQINLNGKNYEDSNELTAEEFYDRISLPGPNPSTSAPTPAAFEKAFAVDKTDVLCITVSSRLSATYAAARAAMDLRQSIDPSQRIWLLDSATAGGAQGLIALAAARAAMEGESLEEVFKVANAAVSKVYFIGVLETVEYLHRGGRIPRIASWAVSLLNIKPVLGMWPGEGKIRMLYRPRSKPKAIEIILNFIATKTRSKPLRVMVMHAACPDEAISLMQQINDQFDCLEMLTTAFTPVIGAHTGPGLLGIAFFTE